MSSDSTPQPDHLQEVFAEILKRHTDQLAHDLAQELADLPDDQLFGHVEIRLRDLALKAAAQAHQELLDQKKKRDIKDQASSADNVETTPDSKDTAPKPS